MAKKKTDWAVALKPLLDKYRGKKHPLDYQNYYQLLVMVVLSAQVTDVLINDLSKKLFQAFPTMEAMSRATADGLQPYIGKVRSFFKKADWLIRISKQLKDEKNIPNTMDALTKLPGIGRKSASVILREMGRPAEGVIVDLHVLRVAPRIGIVPAGEEDPKKIEAAIMKQLPAEDWEVGMSMSFLGREICRPTDPKHDECPVSGVCAYYQKELKAAGRKNKAIA